MLLPWNPPRWGKSRTQFAKLIAATTPALPLRVPVPQFRYRLPQKGDWSATGPKRSIFRLIDGPIRLNSVASTIEYQFRSGLRMAELNSGVIHP